MSSNPKLEEFPKDPGDLGVMAPYRSFDLSPGADALMELLEAVFLFIDSNYQKSNKGIIIFDKLLLCMCDFMDDDECVTDQETKWTSGVISKDASVLVPLYNAIECDYAMVSKTMDNPFKQFRRPERVGLTRIGLIKFIIVMYLYSNSISDDRLYRCLLWITNKYRLMVPGTTRPVMPLDDKEQTDDNFNDLANELGIPMNRIPRQISEWRAKQPVLTKSSASKSPAPKPAAPTTRAPEPASKPAAPVRTAEEAISQNRRSYSSAYRGSPSPTRQMENLRLGTNGGGGGGGGYWYPSGNRQRSPPSPPRARDRERERERGPRRKTLEELEEERDEMEIRAKEQEMRDLEQHYDREAKERQQRWEREYMQMQKKGMEAQMKSTERGMGVMRTVGIPPEYWEDRYRYH
ncbi:hypothetical protein H072_3397 [Dactylellina haptotyla CBS 200.50]|uniref:Uncharacterized protein n=1 Tax=Dactylellina haptotyla (strain CBS 200.50) TaxID=1284197 RepID=S8AIB8_DACHA|nr:hypothetical protein H072_3397 [Dactylellina haptotyla CBS 200.50]